MALLFWDTMPLLVAALTLITLPHQSAAQSSISTRRVNPGILKRFTFPRISTLQNPHHYEHLSHRCEKSVQWRPAQWQRGQRRGSLTKMQALTFTAADIEDLRIRYESADVDGDSWLNKEELRNVLECTETFCLNRHWLPMEQVEAIMAQYDKEGLGRIGFDQFVQLAGDQQLLEGKLDEYLEAFQGIDKDDSGFIDVQEMSAFLETLGSSKSEIEALFEQGDFNDDQKIDFTEFLGLVRARSLDLQAILKYLALSSIPEPDKNDVRAMEVAPQAGVVNLIHGKGEFDAIVRDLGRPLMLMIGFQWCRPCKGFARKYERLAEEFKDVTFLKVFGEENEDTKALVKAMQVKSSPVFYLFDASGTLISEFKGANEERFRTNVQQFLTNAATSR
mmetsp:Transcript_23351/g.39303  ORF Transcript_23351/g.39303 Transcript_23351/m.39303 type:complete len:391 (-) Transcript_23351:348-1520(-)